MSTPSSPFDYTDDVSRLYQEGLKQWQRMVDQQAQTWGLDTTAFTAETVKQAELGQEAFEKSLALVQEAFADLPGRLAAGEPVSAMFQDYLAHMKTIQEQQAAQLGRIIESGSVAWRHFVQEVMQTDKAPWTGLFDGLNGQNGTHALNGQPQPFNIMQNVYEQAVGKWLDTPALGLSREFTEQVNQGVASYQQYKRAEFAYLNHVAKIWGQAFQNLGTEMREKMTSEEGIDSLRGASRLWAGVVDETFGTAFRDPEYIQVQRAYLEAGLDVKKQRRHLLEVYLRAFDLPTLSDIDDASKYIHDLRRKNRALAQQIRAAEAKAVAAEEKAAAAEAESAALEKKIASARSYARDAIATLRKEVRAEARRAASAEKKLTTAREKALKAQTKAADTEHAKLQKQLDALAKQVEALKSSS